jgi:hypothetical protein
MFMLGPNSEFGALADIFVLGASHTVVHPHIQHVHTVVVLAVVSPNVCQGSGWKTCPGISGHRGSEEPVECRGEISRNRLRRPSFNLVAVNEMHDFSVSK